jgi:hypothetical protein
VIAKDILKQENIFLKNYPVMINTIKNLVNLQALTNTKAQKHRGKVISNHYFTYLYIYSIVESTSQSKNIT